MKSLSDTIKDKYFLDNYALEQNFDKKLQDNQTFKKLVTSLKLPKEELMKYTSKLEDTAKELDNCKNCKNIFQCKNYYEGHVCYPEVLNDNLVFDYIPCKYKKALDKQNAYQKNVYLFDIPKEIKEASMKNIDLDDPNRFEVIKWLKQFIDDYKKGIPKKGLYLTGNFGCGKTYLISAALNELAKDNHQVAIIYYPEFLRSLKSSFNESEEYNEKFNQIMKVELLLIDDIGAETTTEWNRDEVLGTILQYRMQEGLTTFFTSNLNLTDLENHFSISNKGVEKVKAKRIIERIKQLSEEVTMIGENKRKWGKKEWKVIQMILPITKATAIQ